MRGSLALDKLIAVGLLVVVGAVAAAISRRDPPDDQRRAPAPEVEVRPDAGPAAPRPAVADPEPVLEVPPAEPARSSKKKKKRSKPTGSTPARERSCCKVCTSGCPCGDSCISCSKTCRKGPGCAC